MQPVIAGQFVYLKHDPKLVGSYAYLLATDVVGPQAVVWSFVEAASVAFCEKKVAGFHESSPTTTILPSRMIWSFAFRQMM